MSLLRRTVLDAGARDDSGWRTYWCLTHEGQSDTGKPYCLRLRARQLSKSVPVPNEQNRCEIVGVVVRLEGGDQ